MHEKKPSKELSTSNIEDKNWVLPWLCVSLGFNSVLLFCIVAECYNGSPCGKFTEKQFVSPFCLPTDLREGEKMV